MHYMRFYRYGMSGKEHRRYSILCVGCRVKECDMQSLYCNYRLQTNPNWAQRRKMLDDQRREAKRAQESDRTRYWREHKQKKKVEVILQA